MLKFYRKQWGVLTPNGAEFEEIETVKCTDTDYFDASGKNDLQEEHAFLPYGKKKIEYFQALSPLLLCPKNLDDVFMYGN